MSHLAPSSAVHNDAGASSAGTSSHSPRTSGQESNVLSASRGASASTPPTDVSPTLNPLAQGNFVQPHDAFRSRPNNALGTFDVFSFIVNKMIGSGIFSAPLTSYILLERNRGLTIGLWFVAFAHSIFSMLVYLDYCSVLPFTGGELVYISEMLSFNINVSALPISKSRRSSADGPGGSVTLHHPKPWWRLLLGDGLAGFVTYSILFICLFSSTSNALHFGRLMQLVIHPPEQNGCKPKTDKDGSDTWRPRRTEANMIGFLTFTTLCLIHYWFSGAGRRINKWTAVIKLAAVVALIIYGGSSYAGKASEDTDSNGNTKRSTEVGGEAGEDDNDVLRSARALLQILFSFQGWENATFVAGETSDARSIRRGFLGAVSAVGILYLSMVSVLVFYIDNDTIEDTTSQALKLNYAPIFSGCNRSATVAWAIVAAFSSLGSMNSIIYTFSRVKQAIGQANVLPWSRFWSSEHITVRPRQRAHGDRVAAAAALDGASISERDHRPSINDISPSGGLALHWLMSTVMIIIVGQLPENLASVGLPGLLQTYAHMLVLAILGFLWFRLSGREGDLGRQTSAETNRFRLSKQTNWLLRPLIFLLIITYASFNVAVLVVAPMTHLLENTLKGTLDSMGWVLSAVVGGTVLFGYTYFVLIFGAADTWYYDFNQRYSGLENNRDHWVARCKDGFPFPSLKQPADNLLRGEESSLLSHSIIGSYLNVLRPAGIKVEVIRETTLGGNILELERVQSRGNRTQIRFHPLNENDKHIGSRWYRNEGEHGPAESYELLPVARNEENAAADRPAARSRVKKPLFFWYWVFGGRRWLDITPFERLVNYWKGFVQGVKHVFGGND